MCIRGVDGEHYYDLKQVPAQATLGEGEDETVKEVLQCVQEHLLDYGLLEVRKLGLSHQAECGEAHVHVANRLLHELEL